MGCTNGRGPTISRPRESEVDLGAVNLQDSGTYVVQGFTGECEIENDTIEVVLHSPHNLHPVLSGDLEACEGVTVTVGADVETVSWTGPNGFTAEGQYVVLPNLTHSRRRGVHSHLGGPLLSRVVRFA